MAILPISLGDAAALDKLNAAIAEANKVAGINAAVIAEPSSRAAAIGAAVATETAARTAAVSLAIANETAARVAAIGATAAAEALARNIAIGNAVAPLTRYTELAADPARPGESRRFTTDISSLPGTVTPVDPGQAQVTDNGPVWPINGAGAVAPLAPWRVEPRRQYRVRFAFQRITDPVAPGTNPVKLAMRWLRTDGTAISTTTLMDIPDIEAADGRLDFGFVYGTHAASNLDAQAPAGTVSAWPYLRTFGLGRTDVEVIARVDLSDAADWSPDVETLINEVSGLAYQMGGFADRLDAVGGLDDGLNAIASFETPVKSISDAQIDGQNDDTAAFEAAVTLNPAGLSFPPGTAVIGDPVDLKQIRSKFSRDFLVRTASMPAEVANAQNIPNIVAANSHFLFDRMKSARVDPTIVCLGDSNARMVTSTVPGPSITDGTGEGAWPCILDTFMNKQEWYAGGRVRGDGRPGYDTTQVLAELESFLTAYGPQIALVSLGSNNVNHGLPVTTHGIDLDKICKVLMLYGAMPFVIGIPGMVAPADPDGTKMAEIHATNSRAKSYCDAAGIEFISITQLILSVPSLYLLADGLHLTALAHHILGGLIHDAILRRYGLPNSPATEYRVSRGDAADPYSWELPGLVSAPSGLTLAQTPNIHVRRQYTHCLQLKPGDEAGFTAHGPFGVLIDPKSTGGMLVNGTDTVLLARENTHLVASIGPRRDSSTGSFTIGAKPDADPTKTINILSTLSWHSAPQNYRTVSATALRNGSYLCNKILDVVDPLTGRVMMQTIMDPLPQGTFADVGRSPRSRRQNVGTTTDRLALSAAYLAGGDIFLDLDLLATSPPDAFQSWNDSILNWETAP